MHTYIYIYIIHVHILLKNIKVLQKTEHHCSVTDIPRIAPAHVDIHQTAASASQELSVFAMNGDAENMMRLLQGGAVWETQLACFGGCPLMWQNWNCWQLMAEILQHLCVDCNPMKGGRSMISAIYSIKINDLMKLWRAVPGGMIRHELWFQIRRWIRLIRSFKSPYIIGLWWPLLDHRLLELSFICISIVLFTWSWASLCNFFPGTIESRQFQPLLHSAEFDDRHGQGLVEEIPWVLIKIHRSRFFFDGVRILAYYMGQICWGCLIFRE